MLKNEDNLRILNMEYLSNHWLDLTHILNLSLGDQNKGYKCFKWSQLPMEDNIKIDLKFQSSGRGSENGIQKYFSPRQQFLLVLEFFAGIYVRGRICFWM